MVDNNTFRSIALSFPDAIEQPHFERAAFKVAGKTIFATLHEEDMMANMALTPEEQSVFCDYDPGAVSPVPNMWGLKGWTTFDLKKASQELIKEALYTAYSAVMNKKAKKRRK